MVRFSHSKRHWRSHASCLLRRLARGRSFRLLIYLDGSFPLRIIRAD